MSWALGAGAVAVVAGLAAVLVLSAVRRTVRRQQAGLPPPAACPPAGRPLLRSQARYLGTTYAPSSVRRFNGYGLLGRRLVGLALTDGGLRVDRDGHPWCIPAGDLRGVEVSSHHAGKEVYADKVLVVDWQLGPATLRSGFVLEETTAPGWAARLAPLVPRRGSGNPGGVPR
ncbi:MAG TPA: hypothetical protein VFC13_08035 [Actinomycetes bacterium]|nr:hypothetical protein [Actinomycetes bacterium]